MKIITIANAFYGPNNVSGGDFIFLEYNKQWQRSGVEINICTNERGYEFCTQQNILHTKVTLFKSCFLDNFGIYIANIIRTLSSIRNSFKVDWKKYDYVFSASDFLPDVLPIITAKIFNPRIKWAGAIYLFTPSLFDKKYRGRVGRLLFYKISQKITLLLMQNFADYIFTASAKDKDKISIKFGVDTNKIMAVRGGVDFNFINSAPNEEKVYDAVFMSRLHPQKNPDELIEIWSVVCKEKPNAKLAVIGSGVEENKMKKMVEGLGIESNVKFFGTLIGEPKIKILKSSRMFISASKFDSGIMALDEAMACGIMGIIYDLPLADYPRGVIKIEMGNKEAFAKMIVTALSDELLIKSRGKEALEFAKTLDWQPMAARALTFITN